MTEHYKELDINKIRWVIEMALQKFSLALNYHNVNDTDKLIQCIIKFKKLFRHKKIEQAMKLSFYIFREFAYEDMKYSDGKKIAQMLQYVYHTYLEIIKFDIKNHEFHKTQGEFSKRIDNLMKEKFVIRL